jgi:hypothetical protein
LKRRDSHPKYTLPSNIALVTQSSFTFSYSQLFVFVGSSSNFLSISSGFSIPSLISSLHLSVSQLLSIISSHLSVLDKLSFWDFKFAISCSNLDISASDAHKFLSTFASSCHFSIN